MALHKSALRTAAEWDFRHKHVNGLEQQEELVDVTDFREVSIRSIDPEQVRKHGVHVGDVVITSGIIVVE